MKSIRIANVSGVRRGKPVLLVGATKADRYRNEPDGRWRSTEIWQHGKAVQAVTHYAQHSFQWGDLLEVKSAAGDVVAYAEIIGITMAEPARFTDADFEEMQYPSRKAYMADWGEILGERVWVYRVRYLKEEELRHDRPG